MSRRTRIVLLIGPRAHNLATVAAFVEAGLDVVGVVRADRTRGAGFDRRLLARRVEQQGMAVTASQIEARLLYALLHRRRDAAIGARLFDRASIARTVRGAALPWMEVADYDAPGAIDWVAGRRPDALVLHTPYWVGKHMRALVDGLVVGGHPGMTPWYRGTHASFWAAYNGEPERLGYTVFLAGAGADTGDVIHQARLDPEPGDSFVTHGWRCMIEIARRQVEVLAARDRGVPVPRRPVGDIPPGSEYRHPTLRQYLEYRRRQTILR